MLTRLRTWMRQRQIRRQHRRVALAFNSLHTFPGEGRGRWMCPTCHTVHEGLGPIAKFSGPIFPACCQFPVGGRIGAEFATLP